MDDTLNSQFQPATVTLPTPTVQDPLNPEFTNDNSLIDNDPYRATFLDNNNNDNTPIMITRSGILEHLED